MGTAVVALVFLGVPVLVLVVAGIAVSQTRKRDARDNPEDYE